jgi:hypothetical protein
MEIPLSSDIFPIDVFGDFATMTGLLQSVTASLVPSWWEIEITLSAAFFVILLYSFYERRLACRPPCYGGGGATAIAGEGDGGRIGDSGDFKVRLPFFIESRAWLCFCV